MLHLNLPASEIHEAKQIVGATSADAGKVITPSAVDGVGELRKLLSNEINWGVTLATTDSKKVLFPSDTVAGDLVFRQVTWPDLDFTGFCTASADSAKVLGPSRTVDGVVELKRITNSEVDHSKDIMCNCIDIAETTVAVTAATDPTLNTESDYIVCPFPITVIDSANVSFDSATKTWTVNAGVPRQKVKISLSASLSASTNNATAAIAYKVNGTLLPHRFKVYGKTAGDWMIGTRHRIIEVGAGDTLQVMMACSVSCNLTHRDMSSTVTRVATE